MKTSWLALFGGGVVITVLLTIFVVTSVWAAPGGQAGDGHDSMHAACVSGDSQAMTDAMKSLTPEDWQAMQKHMADGQHGAMSPDMMNGQGMMENGNYMGNRRGAMGGGMMGMMGW